MLDRHEFIFPKSRELYETESSFDQIVSSLEQNSDVTTYSSTTEVFENEGDVVTYGFEGELATLRNYGNQIHVEGGDYAKELLDELDFS